MFSVRNRSAIFGALTTLVLAGGCVSNADTAREEQIDQGFRMGYPTDLSARQPRPDAGRAAPSSGGVARGGIEPVFFGPEGQGIDRMRTGQIEPGDGDGVTLNFQEADLKQVVEAILGNALKTNYTIAADVGGTVTMASIKPVPKANLLPLLELLLKMNGAELVHTGNAYQVVGSANAAANKVEYMSATPGYGITVIPLEHIAAEALSGLIEGFGNRPGSIRVEKTHNLLMVLGNSQDRNSALETALAFDVDWMEQQLVAIVPLREAKPEALLPELQRVFNVQNTGAETPLVQFMSMPRLKAILVVSQNRKLIERAQTWIARFDRENPDLDGSILVYRAKYRDANVLATLVSKLFAGAGPATAGSNPADPNAANSEGNLLPEQAQSQGGVLATRFGGTEPGTSDEIVPAVFSSDAELRPEAPRIQADAANNSVVIYADAEMRRKVFSALTSIDIPQLQVAINVTMVEVRLTDQLRYGVQYFLKSKSVGLDTDKGSIGLFGTLANNIAREAPGFNFVLGSESTPDIVINALDEITDVRVLSSPSLVVVENETARFQVGDQIPIVTRTVSSIQDANAPVSNQVDYRDTGIIMAVKPRIAENGVVSMKIEQEISSVSSGSNSLTPTISNRSVSSSISVVDGQTVLLGGLISDQVQKGHDGIPGLKDIPKVGNLFGSKNRGNNRTELLILIRPTVIRDSRDAQRVAEELQSKMWHHEIPALK